MVSKPCLPIFILLVAFCFPAVADADQRGMEWPEILGSWLWTGTVTPVERFEPLPGETYILTFAPEGELLLELEANRGFTTYQTDGSSLTVATPIAITEAAWRENSPAPAFLTLLEYAALYSVSGEQLLIDTFADGGTFYFRRR